MISLPVVHGDNHGGPLGHGPLAAVNRGYLDTDPAERLPSLWRIPKRQQLGGAQLSRSATFYSNCARADLPRMRIGDGGFPSLKATVATNSKPTAGRRLSAFQSARLFAGFIPERELSRLDPLHQLATNLSDAAECHSSNPFVGPSFDDDEPTEARGRKNGFSPQNGAH